MKKSLVLFAVFALSLHAFAYDPINEKLIRSFKSSFPNAAGVAWQELPTAYVVSFTEENIRARAFFDKEGTLTQLIRYYHESHLPFAIQHQVKKQFSGKKIFGVIEVTAANGEKTMETEYYLKLEDGRNWITVKVNRHGNTAVTQRLRKA